MARGKLGSSRGRRGSRPQPGKGGASRRTPRTKLTPKASKPGRRPAPATASRPRVPSAAERAAARRRLAKRSERPYRPVAAPPPKSSPRPGPGLAAAAAGATVAAGATAASALQADVNRIRQRFASLESSAQLSDLYQAIGHLDGRLAQLPLEMDELRRRGYVHAGQLEDRIAASDEQWDSTRPQVERALQQQVSRISSDLAQTNRVVALMSVARPDSVQKADAEVQGLDQRIGAARRAVSGLYDAIAEEIDEIDDALDRVDWMLDEFEASTIELRDTEAPLAAAEAEWHENGESGPEGILFLTDQRLLFEHQEEVATKKVLGLIATETEQIQELRLAIEIADVEEIADLEEKSGFLGMGKDEILELVLSANAPVSRARFHLEKQDSTEWALLMKRVKNREIDEDRAEAFIEEAASADQMALTFPTQCPQCFAPVPTPPRGVTSVTCDFCGSVIIAQPPAKA